MAYALLGEPLVQAAYDRRLPIDGLNHIITGQSVHGVEYHLLRARQLVRGLAFLLTASGPLVGVGWLFVRRHPASPWSRPLPAVIVWTTAFLWGLYGLEVPLFETLPGWFWPLGTTDLPALWILVPLLAGAYAVLRAGFTTASRRRSLVLLIVAGACWQHGFAWMDGAGLDTMRSRFTETGHGIFARTAVEQESPWRVLVDYEALLRNGELSPYFHATRPPGLQVLLGLAEAVSRHLPGLEGDRLRRLATLAALLFPLVGYAAVIPLYGLLRRVDSRPTAWTAAALFVSAPSVTLIALHADHYLHPLLGLVFLYLATRALQAGELVSALLAGFVFYLGLWVSFALVALAAVVPALAWSVGRTDPAASRRRLGVAAALGFAIPYLLFLSVGYDAGSRFVGAMAAHEAAKPIAWGLGSRLYFAGINLLEFAVWCAPPLALLCAAELRYTIRAPDRDLGWGVAAGLGLTLAGLAVLGTTAGESARLWIFLVPLVAVCAARQLHRLPEAIRSRALAAVLLLQGGTTLVIKRCQDFF